MRPTKAAPPVAPEEAAFVGPPAGDAPAPVALVSASSGAVDGLTQLVPAGGELSWLSLVLALLAVLGGGTAWRFYRQRSREQHDLKLRELELRATGGSSNVPGCQAEHAAVRETLTRIEVRLAEHDEAGGALTRRVARLEARGTDLELPDTVGSLEVRLAKLEKAARAAKGRSAKS